MALTGAQARFLFRPGGKFSLTPYVQMRSKFSDNTLSSLLKKEISLGNELRKQMFEEIGQVHLAAYGRNYHKEGIKTRSGHLLAAVSQKGAKGNIFKVTSRSVEVGVDQSTSGIPYAPFVFFGTKEHRGKKEHGLMSLPAYGIHPARVLSYVRGIKGRSPLYLNMEDAVKIEEITAKYLFSA